MKNEKESGTTKRKHSFRRCERSAAIQEKEMNVRGDIGKNDDWYFPCLCFLEIASSYLLTKTAPKIFLWTLSVSIVKRRWIKKHEK